MYKRQRLIAEKLGIILVTCGNCGGIMLAKNDDFVDEDDGIFAGHHCPYCGCRDDVCYFPDFFNEPEDYTLNPSPWDSQLDD